MTNGAHSGNARSNTKRACLYLRLSTASKTKYDINTFNQNPAVQEQPVITENSGRTLELRSPN